ncbi:MAG: hypothetical protein KY468_09895, partial [Armatimonadetes bacterium]|nr:hypothetical protein [Armatimonadota bacterium]
MKDFKIGTKSLGTTLAVTAMLGSLALPGVAHASAKGRKNTTIGLGAATAHQLLKGKTTNAVILGAGTAYAYKRYKDAQAEEKRRSRTAAARTTDYRARNRIGGASTSAARTTRTTRT